MFGGQFEPRRKFVTLHQGTKATGPRSSGGDHTARVEDERRSNHPGHPMRSPTDVPHVGVSAVIHVSLGVALARFWYQDSQARIVQSTM